MAKKTEKSQKEIKQEEARKKLAEFIKKTAKSLDVTISSDLAISRTGRNGAIPSSSLCFDLITGGGFPRHRFTILSGHSGGGKTTLMQSAIASQLQMGGMAHYADFEGACDGSWVKNSTGVDLAKFEGGKNSIQSFYPLFDFATGDDFFKYMSRLLEQTAELGLAEDEDMMAHLFCLDSIPSMAPEALVDDDESGSKPYIAMILSKWIPMVRSRLKRANSALVAINQIRSKVRLKNPMENPEYEPGGNTPVFLSDVRVYFDQVQPKHVNGDKHALVESLATPRQGGLWVEANPDGSLDQYVYRKIRTVKNRVYSPFRQSFIRICTSRASAGGEGTGIDPVFDVINFYEELGLLKFNSVKDIVLNGKSYSYFDLRNEILARPDMRLEAASLLDNGKAFDLYAARLTGAGESIAAPTSEEE